MSHLILEGQMPGAQPAEDVAGEREHVSPPPSRLTRRTLALVLLAPCAFMILDSLLSVAAVPRGRLTFDPTARDWPILLVLLSGAWLLLRAPADLTARSCDALLRVVRAGGMAAVMAGEIWALAKLARYADPSSGHLLAIAGIVATLLAALALELRAHWLRRVRAGRVEDYRIRKLESTDRVADAFMPMLRHEACDVLVRLCEKRGSYRGAVLEVPVALIPRRFWSMRTGAHIVL